MSIQAVAYVLDGHPAKGAERLVLLSIANHANENDEAWPSAATIAYEANISVDHAHRCITALVKAGWIERVVNGAPDQRIPNDRRPNLYRLVRVRDLRVPDGGRVREMRGDGYAEYAATGTRNARTKPSGDPSQEPTHTRDGALFDVDEQGEPEGSAALLAAGFDRFWETYPRRTAKGAARRAWPAAVRAAGSIEKILAGARRYRDDPNRDEQYTAHPATWLRAERWDDPPLPARTGSPANAARVDRDRSAPTGRITL